MQAAHVKLELRNAVAIVEVDMVGSLLDFQWYGIATVFDEPPRRGSILRFSRLEEATLMV